MSNLDKRLLAEAFDVLYNENDVAKATRLFQRHWNLAAKNSYALLEAEDEGFSPDSMGQDFNAEIENEAGTDKDQVFEQLQIAVDELEDKFPAEMTEEIQAKFDELRNIIDELKLANEEDEVSTEDAIVVIEDLKADFEVAGELGEDVEALFNEITAGIQGDEAAEEEIDVADEDEAAEEADEDMEDAEEVDEAADVDILADEPAEEPKAEGEESEEEPVEGEVEDEEEVAEEEGEDESDDLDIIYDAKEKVEDLLAKLDELEANEKAEEGEDVEASDEEEEPVEECFTKAKLPRNKLQNEEEGVKKEGMKFGKATSIPVKKGMGVSHNVSAGISADKKVKVEKTENKGAKSWTKVAKPANTAKNGKSVLGN